MCRYNSVKSKVSWCKAGGSGTAPEKPADVISDVLYSNIDLSLDNSLSCSACCGCLPEFKTVLTAKLLNLLFTLVVLDQPESSTSGHTTQPGCGVHLCQSGVNTSCLSTSVANRHVATSLQALYTVGCTTSCALYADSLLVSYSLVTQQ